MKPPLVLFFFLLQVSLTAQDYLTGKLSDGQTNDQQIFYDRTQTLLAKNGYQTFYKILNSSKNLIATVSVFHDRSKSSIVIGIRSAGETINYSTYKYERYKSGLILSNTGNLDTAFDLASSYTYLLSFSDTSRDYPILHKVKTKDGLSITLDPLTKLRLRKHNELSRYIIQKDPELSKYAAEKELESKMQKELFTTQLFRMHDSLYSRNSILAEKIMLMRSKIQKDVALLFKIKKVYPDARRYEGEKRDGKAEGQGLFMSNSNYYDGYFSDGKFVSGIVTIEYDAYEYCGEYSLDSLNGTGLIKYPNESYLMGTFKDGSLSEGIAFSIYKTGEVYFGFMKNAQRAGYGEMYNTKGEMYYGEFLNGVLVKGYSKDSDPFGFFSYSKIENGIKTPVESQVGEAYFNSVLKAKP